MYKRTKWLDRVVNAESGETIQEGTDQSAANFNNMENGIADANLAAALTMIAAHQQNDIYTITYNLVNVKSDNNTRAVKHGAAYVATLTKTAEVSVVVQKVTMGGVDITASAVSQTANETATVSIENVTGNIVVTAQASSLSRV